jgi:hypothetical protein
MEKWIFGGDGTNDGTGNRGLMTPLNWLDAPFAHIGQSFLENWCWLGWVGTELTRRIRPSFWHVVTALACRCILITQAGTFSTSIFIINRVVHSSIVLANFMYHRHSFNPFAVGSLG